MNSWRITLPQGLADFVQDQLEKKAWDSPDMLFAYAVSAMQNQLALGDSPDHDWLRAEVQKGIDEADRGDLLEEDEVFDDILNDLCAPAEKSA